MATTEQFENLIAKAEEMAEKAIGAIAETRGPERPKLFASIASMHLAAATLIHDQLELAVLRRQVEVAGRRLYAIETVLKIRGEDSPIPDVFAEVE